MSSATQPFAGFTPEAIQFLADLARNNDRAWFAPRKADYERLLKEPLEALCVALADRFAARGIPLAADPKRSPFRIYRDTRFSKDKSPYKTNLGASFPWVENGRRGRGGGRRRRPRERRLLQLPARRDVRGRRDVEAGEAAARRLPAGARRVAGSRAGGLRGPRLRGLVR